MPINLVGSGVDTLILNVRYCDSKSLPLKQELDEKLAQELDYRHTLPYLNTAIHQLDEKLAQELDYLQGEDQRVETAVATDRASQNVLLFVEPYGAGKQ